MTLSGHDATLAAEFAAKLAAKSGQSGPEVESLSQIAAEMFDAKIDKRVEEAIAELLPTAVIPGRTWKSAFAPWTIPEAHSINTYCNTIVITLGKALGGSVEREYWWARDKVIIFDVGCERIVEITGPKAEILADYITPRDLTILAEPRMESGVTVGQCAYVVITNRHGGIENDPVLLKRSKNHYWLMLSTNPIIHFVDEIAGKLGLGPDDVQVSDPNLSTLQIQGLLSEPVITDVFGPEVPKVLDYYEWAETQTLSGQIPVIITRTGYTGLHGYEVILLDNDRAEELYFLLRKHGERYEMELTGPSDPLRMESGMMSWGIDMDGDDTPFHVFNPFMLRPLMSLNWGQDVKLKRKDLAEVDFSYARLKDADYSGKPRHEEILQGGVLPMLDSRNVGVRVGQGRWLDDITARKKGIWPVLSLEGRPIGGSRSLSYSGALERVVGFARVDMQHALKGSKFLIVPPEGDPQTALVTGDHRFIWPGKKGAIS